MPNDKKVFDILKRVDLNDPTVREKEQLDPGRKVGTTHGSWISDLVELMKSIILCDRCSHKFDHKTYRYYKQREFPFVLGRCDACKNFGRSQFYLHWSVAKKVWDIKQQYEDDCKPRWF